MTFVGSVRVPVLLYAIALLLIASPGQGQEIPRTPSGMPDLSGTYDIATLTPLSRPEEFGDKLFLTQEEADAIRTREAEYRQLRDLPTDPDRSAPRAGGAPPVGLDDSQSERSGAGNVGGYNNFWVDRGSEAFAVDGRYRTSIITDPKNGRQPAMTPEARARRAQRFRFYKPNDGKAWWVASKDPGPYDGPESLSLGERCLVGFGSTGGPPMLSVLYNNHKRLVLTDDHLMILTEMVHDVRIVRIAQPGEGEHSPADLRHWLGDSVGRWQGDTLVVTTKNFRETPAFTSASPEMVVTERFSMLDGDTLFYEFTVDDAATWTAPWAGSYTWPATDKKVYEYACHEGNYAMEGILKGARLLEAEALAAASTDD